MKRIVFLVSVLLAVGWFNWDLVGAAELNRITTVVALASLLSWVVYLLADSRGPYQILQPQAIRARAHPNSSSFAGDSTHERPINIHFWSEAR